MNYVVTSGTTVDFSRYCSTFVPGVHPMCTCSGRCRRSWPTGYTRSLPWSCWGDRTSQSDCWTLRTGQGSLCTNHSLLASHCLEGDKCKVYQWFLQSSFLMVTFCSLPIIACMYSSLTLMLWFSGSAALGQVLPHWLTLLQYWNRVTQCTVKILRLRYFSLQMLQLK